MLRSTAITLLLLLGFGCGSEPEPVTLRGHTDECALVVFESSVDDELVRNFPAQHTDREMDDGEGFWLREGIRSVVKRGYDSRRAYEVCFTLDAPPSIRDSLIEEMTNAPGVEEVRRIAVDPSTGTLRPE